MTAQPTTPTTSAPLWRAIHWGFVALYGAVGELTIATLLIRSPRSGYLAVALPATRNAFQSGR